MKIVFFCIPAHGHTNPTLGVVRELVSRGHQVWYYSYNAFREKIETAGAVFVSCDGFDAELKLSRKDFARLGNDLAFSTRILVDTTLALDDMVCNDIKKLQPDCIVSDSMALWGKAIALKLGIPFVSSTTTFAFNQHSAKVIKQSLGDLVKMLLSLPRISKQIKRLQSHGYPVKNILDIIGTDADTHTIVYTSPEFQPCSDTFSPKFAFVGPSVRQPTDNIKKTRDKLIYVSMGTVNNDMKHFYKTCISAFADTDYQVIMSVGDIAYDQIRDCVPDNISVFPFADQIAVLQQADVFISHCGMNSVSESLYFEVPLVMFPKTSEQKGVAGRVLQLGAGISPRKADVASIISSVNQIISDNSYKQNAKKISRTFKNCQGADGAADKIISVCHDLTKE